MNTTELIALGIQINGELKFKQSELYTIFTSATV